jgi:hypothetical protein
LLVAAFAHVIILARRVIFAHVGDTRCRNVWSQKGRYRVWPGRGKVSSLAGKREGIEFGRVSLDCASDRSIVLLPVVLMAGDALRLDRQRARHGQIIQFYDSSLRAILVVPDCTAVSNFDNPVVASHGWLCRTISLFQESQRF